MNPSDPATDFITRRDFMKKSVLTIGAITLLSQGIGLATGTNGSGSGSGSWGMLCIAPLFENSSVRWFSPMSIGVAQRDVPENTNGDFAYFLIQVEINSNKINDPPSTQPYNECNVSYTAKISILSGNNPYVDYFVDYLVLCSEDSGSIWWTKNYCNWDSDEKSITVSQIGDFDVARVKINIRRNNGNPLSFFLKVTYIDDYYSPMRGPYFGNRTPSIDLYEGEVNAFTIFKNKLK